MTKVDVAKVFAVAGILWILLAIVLKWAGTSCIIGFANIRLLSLLVIANCCFSLAALLKK